MPIRLVVPLPGPFAWVGRSRMEKDYDRARRAAYVASLSEAQKFRRGLVVALVVWAVVISGCAQAGPGWVLAGCIAAGLNLSMGLRVERRRRRALLDADDEDGQGQASA